jgi:glycerol uptake facilitator-like aquaporin
MGGPNIVQKAITEVLGVAMLVYIGGLSVAGGAGVVGISLAHGFVIATMIFIGGPVSGGHFNPSVTIALVVTKDCPAADAGPMIGAQLAGSFVGALMLWALKPKGIENYDYGYPVISGDGNSKPKWWKIMLVEFLATFVLCFFVVGSVKSGYKAPAIGAGVGCILAISIMILAGTSGGSLNICRTLGPAVLHGKFFKKHAWTAYYLGPLLGTAGGIVAGMFTHAGLDNKGGQEYEPALNTAKGADGHL